MLTETFMDGAKQQLASAIKGYAVRHRMNQTDMAYLLETAQPRISNLFNGKLDKFSVDQLMQWAYNLGISIQLTAKENQHDSIR